MTIFVLTIIESVTINYTGKICRDKHSSLLGSFSSYKEDEVITIHSLNNIQKGPIS
jgi:hypothetical protein